MNSACSIQLTHTRIEEQELNCARESILREARELAAAEAEAAAAAAVAEQQAPDTEASSAEPGPSAPLVAESADNAEGVGVDAMDTDEMSSLDRELLNDLYGEDDDAV